MQLWDDLLELRFRGPVARYLQLRMSDPLLRVSLRWWSLLLMGGTLSLTFFARAYPLAIMFAFLCSVAPPYVIGYLIKQREQLLESQLIASSTGLANALKAGLSIPEGLKSVANETPTPLCTELQQIVYQFEHGRPLAETLSATRQRLQLEPFTLFCLALEVAVERGGRVNLAMERLSTSLQEWFRLKRKLDADTSSALCGAGHGALPGSVHRIVSGRRYGINAGILHKTPRANCPGGHHSVDLAWCEMGIQNHGHQVDLKVHAAGFGVR